MCTVRLYVLMYSHLLKVLGVSGQIRDEIHLDLVLNEYRSI